MRRQMAAVALATTALLTVTAMSAAVAQAVTPARLTTEDNPIPVGDSDPAAPDQGVEDGPAADASGGSSADREAALARGSRQAADLVGFMPSLYQGKWFMPKREDVRRCIVLRESHANYRATSGAYHGAYQMSSELAVGATWMMQDEVAKEMGAEGVAIVRALRELTPNKWNRYWQDRAFWTIWRNGEGRQHWGGGSHGC